MATSARETAGTTPSSAANKTDDVTKLKKELDRLRGDFGSLSDSIKRVSSQGGDAGRQYARESADAAQRLFRDQTDTLEQQIKAQPLIAVGVAFGVGFVLGKLLLRR